jgi:phenylacetate-CoA ligase
MQIKIKKNMFLFGHKLFDKRFLTLYNSILENQWKPYSILKKETEEKLNSYARFSYENVAYYHKLFIDYGININNFGYKSLSKLPILNKSIINDKFDEFIPKNLNSIKYRIHSTGGTTGTPMKYRTSHEHRLISGLILYKGWSMGGYNLSDSMLMLGGASIVSKNKYKIIDLIQEKTRNIKKLSSFDMSEVDMENYLNIMNKFKPKFIRGYPSSIYFFAKWLKNKKKTYWRPNAVFTTSEKLHLEMRNTISEVFNCGVYDGYGLNDGGVQAFECCEHKGMHIMTENAITEILDYNGDIQDDGNGQILATSINNFAFPFFRYNTGDNVEVSIDKCECGRESQIIKNIEGRTVDILITPDNNNIHGWFFLYIFWKYDKGIVQYQVIQEDLYNINIKIVKNSDFDFNQIKIIQNIVKERSPKWILNFEFVDYIEKTMNGKFKFIINNYKPF